MSGVPPLTQGRTLRRAGLAALVFYALHVVWHVTHGAHWDLFWVCNVSMPLLAFGCFVAHARLCVASVLILSYGTPMWVLDLATGGVLVPTSLLTHLGGLAAGILAVRRLGWPPGAWRFGCLVTLAVLAITRVVTPAGPNVNLAFRVHDGWERWFPHHSVYLAMMWTGSALWFFAVERAVRFVASKRRPV